jgi:predicted dehydrogenase
MRIGVFGGLGNMGRRRCASIEKLNHVPLVFDPKVDSGDMESAKVFIASCDAIVISSPADTHTAYLLEALGQDKPVFCEKPLIPLRETKILKVLGEELQDNRAGRLSSVGFNLRFRPQLPAMREFVKTDDPYWATFICSHAPGDGRELSREMILNEWLVHEIDLALHLFGLPSKVDIMADQDGKLVDLLVEHDNGRCSHIHCDMLSKTYYRRGCLVGINNVFEYEFPLSESGPDYHAEIVDWIKLIDSDGKHQSVGAGLKAGAICSLFIGKVGGEID